MPDMLKKASKQAEKICDADETPVAALFVRPRNGDDVKRLGTPGGAIGNIGRLADQMDEDDEEQPVEAEAVESTDPRSLMFGQNAVLVLTEHRLLAFGHGTYSGRVKGLLGAVELGAISSLELDAPPIGESGAATLEIAFADGESVSLAPGSRRRRFVEAFDELAQPV
ncbi:MAG: hypothetical protein AAF480_10215 [Actinomycetota bacterium]